MQSILPVRSAARVASAHPRPIALTRSTRRSSRVAQCAATSEADQLQASVVKATALTSAVGTLLAAGNVSAAQELAQISAADGRLGPIAVAALPVLAWVGFNIFGPALNQVQAAAQKKASYRSLAGLGLGLSALLAAQQASAASEVSELAAGGGGRFGVIFLLLLPALGWVLFNIAGPALAQLDNMSKKGRRRGIAGAVGLTAATLLATQQADAASEVSQLAEGGGGRFGVIFLLLLPALGWVLFNILGPATAQLDNMNNKLKRQRGIAGALGLTAASMVAAQQADAASEVSQLADGGGGRAGVIFLLLLPALGWVLFNILGPASAQLDNMNNKLKKQRGIAGALGLTAASMLAAQQADAASEVSQLAAGGGGRAGVIFLLLLPALGWVLFNILGPASAQLDNMNNKLKGR